MESWICKEDHLTEIITSENATNLIKEQFGIVCVEWKEWFKCFIYSEAKGTWSKHFLPISSIGVRWKLIWGRHQSSIILTWLHNDHVQKNRPKPDVVQGACKREIAVAGKIETPSSWGIAEEQKVSKLRVKAEVTTYSNDGPVTLMEGIIVIPRTTPSFSREDLEPESWRMSISSRDDRLKICPPGWTRRTSIREAEVMSLYLLRIVVAYRSWRTTSKRSAQCYIQDDANKVAAGRRKALLIISRSRFKLWSLYV